MGKGGCWHSWAIVWERHEVHSVGPTLTFSKSNAAAPKSLPGRWDQLSDGSAEPFRRKTYYFGKVAKAAAGKFKRDRPIIAARGELDVAGLAMLVLCEAFMADRDARIQGGNLSHRSLVDDKPSARPRWRITEHDLASFQVDRRPVQPSRHPSPATPVPLPRGGGEKEVVLLTRLGVFTGRCAECSFCDQAASCLDVAAKCFSASESPGKEYGCMLDAAGRQLQPPGLAEVPRMLIT